MAHFIGTPGDFQKERAIKALKETIAVKKEPTLTRPGDER